MRAPDSWQGRPSWVEGDIFVRAVSPMRLHAWEPWDFARHILFSFQNMDIDDEHPEWRLYWFSGVVTLRSVGHVLDKVDRKINDNAGSVIDDWWTSVKADRNENWIFFDFIEKERNNVLKEFSFGASLTGDHDGRQLAYDGSHLDGAQLFREAVYWWRAQLEYIEAAQG
jgi:hypothetical protein